MGMRYVKESTTGDAIVTLAAAKDFMKISVDADDGIIQKLINDATSFAERFTGKSTQITTWSAFADYFEACWYVNKAPVIELVDIQYVSDGQGASLAQDVYELKPSVFGAEISLIEGQTIPSADNIADAIRVQFKTGIHPHSDELEHAILRHVAWLYENRGDDADHTIRQADFYRRVSSPRV